MELAGGQIVQLVGGCIGQLDGSGNSPAMLVSPQIRPIEIVELAFHHFVEFLAEHRQVRAAARVFFVEPSHQDDVRYRCDVPAQSPRLRGGCGSERSILLRSRIGSTSCQVSATMMESFGCGTASRMSRVCIIA